MVAAVIRTIIFTFSAVEFNMHKVTNEEKFLFDIQGFLILRGATDSNLVEALDRAVVENEALDHDESWADNLPVVTAQHFIKDTNIAHQVRLNGLPRLNPVFDRLISHWAHPALPQGIHGRATAREHLVDLEI